MIPEAKPSFILSTAHIPSKCQHRAIQNEQGVSHGAQQTRWAWWKGPQIGLSTSLGMEAPGQGLRQGALPGPSGGLLGLMQLKKRSSFICEFSSKITGTFFPLVVQERNLAYWLYPDQQSPHSVALVCWCSITICWRNEGVNEWKPTSLAGFSACFL